MHLFSVTSANIAINDISLKTRFFGLYISVAESVGIYNHSYVMGSNSYGIR